MKLLFCIKCNDVIKLVEGETRSCKCGICKGKYINHHEAVTNGQGICLAISNPALRRSVNKLICHEGHEANIPYDVFRSTMGIETWVRPHTGLSNPRSTIDRDLQ